LDYNQIWQVHLWIIPNPPTSKNWKKNLGYKTLVWVENCEWVLNVWVLFPPLNPKLLLCDNSCRWLMFLLAWYSSHNLSILNLLLKLISIVLLGGNFVRIIGKGKKCHNARLTKQPWLIKVANKHDLNFKMLDHYNMKFVHQIQSFHCHFLCFIFIKNPYW
jgi:hypothetical protein